MDGSAVARFIDGLIDRYPDGFVEVLASVFIQLVYLLYGLLIELTRPRYTTCTSRTMLVLSLWNHAVATMVHIAFVVFMGGRPVLTRTFLTRPFKLPSWPEVLIDLARALMGRDFLFYIIHRLWHVLQIYGRVHKKHHKILHPSRHHVWTISYMSVTDFLFLYGAPVMALAKLWEMNLVTTMLFALISAVGEQIKLIVGYAGHDEHHLHHGPPFGVYGVADYLVGTLEASLRAWHRTAASSTPAKKHNHIWTSTLNGSSKQP